MVQVRHDIGFKQRNDSDGNDTVKRNLLRADFVAYKMSFILERLIFKWILIGQNMEKMRDWDSEDILGIQM